MVINIIFTFVLLIACIGLPSYAAGFTLDYSIGFNGHFQLDSWTPLSVILDNRGRAVNGSLEVIVTSGSEYRGNVYRTVYQTNVDLPQNSTKLYAFTIIVKAFTHEMIVRLRQDDEILYSRSINLRSHFTEKNFAVVADNYVVPDILAVLPAQLHPANVRPKFLPETWYGYGSVKLLILRIDTIRQLRNRQFQALIQWVNQGGYLVLGTGLNYGSLGDQRLQDILPIRVTGHRQFSELKSLGPFCDRELTGTKPFLVLNARMDDSKILAQENGIPIITRRNIGYGKVIFLSFDLNTPPFSRWDGRRLFWNKILSLQPKIDRPMIKVNDQQIVNSMLAGLPVKFPKFRSIAIFVGIYLIILLFLFKKIKKPGRSRRRYSLFFIVTILFFTFIGYRGFYSPNLKHKISYNSFCQLDIADPDAPAAARYYIGLYSLANLEYGLKFDSYFYPVSHIISDQSTAKVPNPYVLQNKDDGQHLIGSIQPWQHNFYQLNLHLTSPVAGYARHDKSFVTVMVENSLPHNLVDCLIYYRKRIITIEDILAGSRQTIKLDWTKLKKMEFFSEHEVEAIVRRFDDNGAGSYLRKIQKKVTSDLLFKIHNKYKSRPGSMILLGWVRSGLIQPDFDRIDPPGAGVTMINWELPVEIIL
ncbi:MAG: hypothetical protein GY850_11560 [bacterium]|nr:hypothetical protein [bacterium]